VASAQSRTRSDLGESSPVTGDSRQHARFNSSTQAQELGRTRRFIVTNAANSARKNSDVSAGTDCPAKVALCMTEILGWLCVWDVSLPPTTVPEEAGSNMRLQSTKASSTLGLPEGLAALELG